VTRWSRETKGVPPIGAQANRRCGSVPQPPPGALPCP
jgi:hypothetical protein